MTDHYVSFMDDIWTKFPTFAEKELTDLTNHNLLWTLDEYRKANYVNFKTGKKELYRLSILIENYAEKHDTPLLATFETEARYKYVEDRYLEILSKISNAWIIGNFINNISPMWIVLTKGENGPFGLVAEDIGDHEYRGFFTSNTNILSNVIDDINEQLKIKITI